MHLPDVKEDPELKGSVVARLTASRTVVGVPMLRDGRSIGGMVLARYQVRPFEEHELDLVQTFADQAAIAIENVRLFNETKEALERQTAISEVLRAISGSAFDIRPVMETVITNAARLSDGAAMLMLPSKHMTLRSGNIRTRAILGNAYGCVRYGKSLLFTDRMPTL